MVGLCSSAAVAVSTSLQHQASGGTPRTLRGCARHVSYLLRQPRWLAGQALSLCAFGMHAVALQLGALAVVQPVVVSGIVFAVPVRALLGGRLPQPVEFRAVLITAIGLATFLVASRPEGGEHLARDGRGALAFTCIGLACAALTHFLAGNHQEAPRRAALFGVTSGILFGLMAGLLKLVVVLVQDDGVAAALLAWPMWALVFAGVAGTVVNQRAYRTAALSASMPVLNVVDVVVALGFGHAVFHEIPGHSPTAIVAELIALGCVAFGLRTLTARDHAPGPPPRPSVLAPSSDIQEQPPARSF